MMTRRLLLASFVAFALVATARANTFVATASVVQTNNTGGTAPSTNTIVGSTSGGYSFDNTTSQNVGGGLNSVVSFKSVGSDQLSGGYGQFGGGSIPATYTDGSGTHQVIAVFAVSGTVAVNGVGATLSTSTAGGVSFYAAPVGNSYNQFNPATWGTGGTLLAQFNVVNPPFLVTQGATGAGGTVSPAVLNQVAINFVNPTNQQGDFLFKQNTAVGVPGFLTTPLGVPDPGQVITGEGLHGFLNQKVDQPSSIDPTNPADDFRFLDPGGPTAGGGLGVLNTIATSLGVGTFAPTFFNGAAPTGGDPTGTGFAPYAGPGYGGGSQVLSNGSGDFGVNLGITTYPGFIETPLTTPTTIPEPTSMLLWGLFAAGSGAYGVIRRRRATRAA